ncbi:lasso RiPP family leader peptide-containing protein [Actinosynnema sp. NPDC023587]
MTKKTLPERYEAPQAAEVGRFATDTRAWPHGFRDHRGRGRRRG